MSCLKLGPSKFKEFLELIKRVAVEKDTLAEIHKSKLLN